MDRFFFLLDFVALRRGGAVAPDDVGKVIGRQGRLARALRTIVRAGSVREGRRVVLEIVD